ncbi:hypothetical protein C8J57DRAFT_1391790, partial [Mycena rebaudengoi]
MLQFCAKHVPCRTPLSSQPAIRIRFAPQANRFFCRTTLAALPGQSVNPPDPSIRNHDLPLQVAGFVSCSTIIDTGLWVQKLTLTERVRRWIAGPKVVEATLRDAYVYVANSWINASPAQRLCWGMVAFNGTIFIGWKIHRLTPFMMNNFLHNPHSEFFHFAFSNMALASRFGILVAMYLSNQQAKGSSGRLKSTNAYHLFALYLSAGLFSSLVAHAYWIRIYKALTATMVKTGQARAIPAVTILPIIPIQYAVCGLVTLDMIGLASKWRRFDRGAHLGGALFGMLYYMYGPKIWDILRVTTARQNGGCHVQHGGFSSADVDTEEIHKGGQQTTAGDNRIQRARRRRARVVGDG